jgi:hypothetical protein
MQKKSPFTATGYGKSWGGCEELWSRTAMDLAKEGFAVSASIVAWFPPHERVLDLADRGLDIWFRPWLALTTPEKSFRSAGDAAPRPKQTGRYGRIHRPRASHDRMLLLQLC